MKRLRKIVAIQGNPSSIFNHEGFKQEAENHRQLGLAFIMLNPGGKQATDRLSEAEDRLAIKLEYKGTSTAADGKKVERVQKTDAQTVFGYVVYIFQELIDHYNDKLSKTMTAVSSKPLGKAKVSPVLVAETHLFDEISQGSSLLASGGSSQPSSSTGVSTSGGVNVKGINFWASEKGKAITALLNVLFQCHGEAPEAPPYIIDGAGKLSLKKGIYLDPNLELGGNSDFARVMRDFHSCDSRKTMRPAYEKLMLLHNTGYFGDVAQGEGKPAISQVRYRSTFFPKDLEYSKLNSNDIRTLIGIIGEKATESTRSATLSAVSLPSNPVASNTSFYEYLKAQGPVRIFEGVKTELRVILNEKGLIPYSNILFIREQLLAYRLELKRSLDQLHKEGVADLGVSRASTLKSDLEATLAAIEFVHAKMDGIIRCLWDINVANVRPAVVEVPREPIRPTVRTEIREIMVVFDGEISNFSARTLRRDPRRSSSGLGSGISDQGIAYVWQFLTKDFQDIADKIMGISGDLTAIEGVKMQQLLMQLKNLAELTHVEVEDETYATVDDVRSGGEEPPVFQKPLSDAIKHCEGLVRDLNVTARDGYLMVRSSVEFHGPQGEASSYDNIEGVLGVSSLESFPEGFEALRALIESFKPTDFNDESITGFLKSVMDCKENFKFLSYGIEDDTIATQLKSKLEEISLHLGQVSDESWSHFHYLYSLVTNRLHETHGERAHLLTQQKHALEAHLKAVFSESVPLSQSILFNNKLALITMLYAHWLECANEKEYNVRNNLAVQLNRGDYYHEELVALIGTLSQHVSSDYYTLASRSGELDESDMTQFSRPSARLRGLKERMDLNDAESSDILKFHAIDKTAFLDSMQSLWEKILGAADNTSVAFDDPNGVEAKVFACYLAVGKDVKEPSFSGILEAIHNYDAQCKAVPTYGKVGSSPSSSLPPVAPALPLRLNVSLNEVSNAIPQDSSLDLIRVSVLALASLSWEQKKGDITNFKPPLSGLGDLILALTGQDFCDAVVGELKAKHVAVAQERQQQQQQLQLQQQQQARALELQQQADAAHVQLMRDASVIFADASFSPVTYSNLSVEKGNLAEFVVIMSEKPLADRLSDYPDTGVSIREKSWNQLITAVGNKTGKEFCKAVFDILKVWDKTWSDAAVPRKAAVTITEPDVYKRRLSRKSLRQDTRILVFDAKESDLIEQWSRLSNLEINSTNIVLNQLANSLSKSTEEAVSSAVKDLLITNSVHVAEATHLLVVLVDKFKELFEGDISAPNFKFFAEAFIKAFDSKVTVDKIVNDSDNFVTFASRFTMPPEPETLTFSASAFGKKLSFMKPADFQRLEEFIDRLDLTTPEAIVAEFAKSSTPHLVKFKCKELVIALTAYINSLS